MQQLINGCYGLKVVSHFKMLCLKKYCESMFHIKMFFIDKGLHNAIFMGNCFLFGKFFTYA